MTVTTDRPAPLQAADTAAARELRTRRIWVMWRLEKRTPQDKAPTKIPYTPSTGRRAKSNDPRTWGSHAEAVAALEHGGHAGIGVMIKLPFFYVDLDHCRNPETGEIHPAALTIVRTFKTYTEISHSLAGVKLIGRCDKFPDVHGKNFRRKPAKLNCPANGIIKWGPNGGIELYGVKARLFCFTGFHLADTPDTINDASAALAGLHERLTTMPPLARCLAFVAKMPRAVSGEGGHNATLAVACETQRFNLSDADAMTVLHHFNSTLGEQWTPEELAHKLEGAKEMAAGERGSRLHEGRATYSGDGDGHHSHNGEGRARAEQSSVEATTNDERFTDMANVAELVAQFGDTFRHHHERDVYLVRNHREGRWKDDATGHVARCAKTIGRAQWDKVPDAKFRKDAIRHATRSESAPGIGAMLTLARSEPGIAVTAAMLDADPWAMNTLSGVVNLRTGELRPHSPTDLITKLAPVVFDPAAQCPRFDAFMHRIMADNATMIGYLRRVLGMCLTGDISVQELWVFHGQGANGKSVLLDTFAGLLGDYAGLAPPGLLTTRAYESHPTEIADLCGLRVVLGSETEEGATLKIQLIKRMTGDATLKARHMRCDFFEFQRQFKLILATNNRPRIPENTCAVWRRLRLVPFGVTIPPEEQDPRLSEKLRAEWPGILACAVRGCLEWQRDGLQTPPEVLAATAAYQAEQDVLGDYLTARCVRGEHVKVSRPELFADYQSWAVQTGERHPLERNALYDRIRRLDGVTDDQWKPVGSTSPVRGFRGIGLAFIGGQS